jgi:hypothetical protein
LPATNSEANDKKWATRDIPDFLFLASPLSGL